MPQIEIGEAMTSHGTESRGEPMPSVVLGIGTGRCGLRALVDLFDRQPGVRAHVAEPPLLPWRAPDDARIGERLRRLRRTREASIVADVAPFYLPYLEQAIALEPGIRVICLERPCEEVVASFLRWSEAVGPLPTDHWADRPAAGWHHDPIWTRAFPQYVEGDRAARLRRYWTEYHDAAGALTARFPENFRIFSPAEAFGTRAGLRAVLAFAGIPEERQVLPDPGSWRPSPAPGSPHPRRSALAGADPRDPRRCVVLVPHLGQIAPPCEQALHELERRGYTVWRVGGYAAIDQGRNQMATDALVEGFEETMWIDADIGFEPDALDLLRAHDEPIVCGIYPQKGRRMLACHVLPGTAQLVFGAGGGLVEIRYAAGGFLLVRRGVYMDIQRRLGLPVCNEHFGRPLIPFFQPMVRPRDEGTWYLADDFAFCERARRCGYRVLADTTIRLWHYGYYPYGWEDAGVEPTRYATFHLGLD
jgi:hypothetical protein